MSLIRAVAVEADAGWCETVRVAGDESTIAVTIGEGTGPTLRVDEGVLLAVAGGNGR